MDREGKAGRRNGYLAILQAKRSGFDAVNEDREIQTPRNILAFWNMNVRHENRRSANAATAGRASEGSVPHKGTAEAYRETASNHDRARGQDRRG